MTPTAAANGRREDTLTLPLRGSVAAACEACAERVAAELRALPGVRQTAVEENSGALRVDFDPAAVSPDRLSERARAAADALAARYDHRSYRIGGMDCANCALSIEKSVQSLPGVTTARVNFPAARLKVEQERAEDGGDATDAVIRDRVRALGFSLTGGATTATTATTATAATAPDHAPDTAARPSWRDGLPLYLSGAFLALGLVLEYALAGRVPEAAANAAFALSIVLGGHRFGLAGLRALLTGTLGTNLLMALAAAGAVYLGEWGEAAMVVFLYALGEHLERGAMERARRSLKELIDAAPATAERLLADGSTEIVAAESLEVGERVLVKPGAKLPADGVITAGASDVAEAAITGEPLPRAKGIGDTVFAGSVNGTGALTVEVTAPGDDTTLARILHMVEEAQARKAPAQAFVERFGRMYTPLVLVAAVAIAVLGPLVAPGPNYLYRALTLLVVACPCALVIATPVAYAAGIARAARSGILLKGGAVLETLAAARAVALDKTGTLTTGRPEVTAVVALGATEEETLRVGAAAERMSEHPLAAAVVAEAERRGLTALPEAWGVEAVPGRGITATMDGVPVAVGNLALMAECGVAVPEPAREAVARHQATGATVLLVARAGALLGAVAVADAVRPEAADAVRQMRDLGLSPVMLTGDAGPAAEAVGARVGVSEVYAGLLPQDKLEKVRERSAREAVVFVGDGINDAPALAAASVGVAMGAGGTAAAIEAADVALMESDLDRLPQAVRLARATRAVVRQNMVISLGAVALLLAVTFAGALPLPLGVLGHEGSALLVIANGIRLLSPRLTRVTADAAAA